MSFVVPSILAKTVEAEPSPDRFRWLASLGDTVHELASLGDLAVGEPLNRVAKRRGSRRCWIAMAANWC